MADVKHLPISEFRADGYMQEVNRRLLHPLGLALEATIVDDEGDGPLTARIRAALIDEARVHVLLGLEPDAPEIDLLAGAIARGLAPPGSQRLSGVWDYRDDPEGVHYGGLGPEDDEKALRIDRLWDERRDARVRALGFMIEPTRPTDGQ